jgi:regulator of protease activity HflC (stomatin/prohibitin superfamily)
MSRHDDDVPSGIILAALLALVSLVCLVTSCSTIDSGHVGVVKHFGAVQPYTLPEGMHFLRPWASVDKVDVKMRAISQDAKAASKDLQVVETAVTVQYSIQPGFAPRMAQRFGFSEAAEAALLKPAIQESVKSVTSLYNAERLITHRAEVKGGIERAIAEFVDKTLRDKDIQGAVRLANVAVTDFEFSPEFNHAIEQKVKAEQEALKAENEKKKRVTQAEAEAAERRLSAESIAFKTEVESKARAEAIARESKALEANPNLIQLRIAERWNGQLPHYTGSGPIPMLQVK